MSKNEIFEMIRAERARQDVLHPGTHSDEKFLAVLMEEVGEVAKAMQETSNLTEEIVQVAAVCVRWLESL